MLWSESRLTRVGWSERVTGNRSLLSLLKKSFTIFPVSFPSIIMKNFQRTNQGYTTLAPNISSENVDLSDYQRDGNIS